MAIVQIGPVFCGAGANVTGFGVDWTNPSNIAGDTNFAASATLLNQTTNRLDATSFDTAFGAAGLVASDTITGLQVDWEASSRFAQNDTRILDMRLLIGGTPAGDIKGPTANFGTAYVYYSFGGSTDTWGLTLVAANFLISSTGIYLRSDHSGGSSNQPQIRRCRMTLWVDREAKRRYFINGGFMGRGAI